MNQQIKIRQHEKRKAWEGERGIQGDPPKSMFHDGLISSEGFEYIIYSFIASDVLSLTYYI